MIDGGRLDIVYQCILTSIFKAHGHRHDVIFHVVLNGPPKPPIHIKISGEELRDARIDERTWEKIFRNVLNGKKHTGISMDKLSLQRIVRDAYEAETEIFVLEEKGDNIRDIIFKDSVMFILGDHIGIPKNDEKFILRFGKKLSLGKVKYLAASCIDIVNYNLDTQFLG